MKMSMKNTLFMLGIAFWGMGSVFAQETAKDVMEQRKIEEAKTPVAHRFDSTLFEESNSLEAQKAANKAKKEQLIAFISTQENLKEREKQHLIDDVKNNPFSNKLRRFVAEHKALLISSEQQVIAGLEQ